ncbi:hypothetical protein V8C43DRAFT_164083 [Trichoderma afarasin]
MVLGAGVILPPIYRNTFSTLTSSLPPRISLPFMSKRRMKRYPRCSRSRRMHAQARHGELTVCELSSILSLFVIPG